MQRIKHTTQITISKATADSEKSRVRRFVSYGLGRLGFATSAERIERELKETEREILASSGKKGGILKHHLELESSEAPAKKRRIHCSPLQFLYEDAKPYKKQLVRRSANLTEALFFIKLPPTMQRYICSFLSLEDLAAVMLTSVDLYQLARHSQDDIKNAFAKNRMQLLSKNYALFKRTTVSVDGASDLFKILPNETVILGFHEEKKIGIYKLGGGVGCEYHYPSFHNDRFDTVYAELVLDQKILVSCTKYGGRFCAIDVETKKVVAEFEAPYARSKVLSNGQIASWVAGDDLKIYECKFNSRDQQYFFDLVHTFPILTFIADIIAIKDYYIITDCKKTHSIHAQTKEYQCIFNSEEVRPLINLTFLWNNAFLLRLFDRNNTKYDSLYVIDLKNKRNPKIKKNRLSFSACKSICSVA